MNQMDERDALRDLDWSAVYADVPDSVSAGVQYAFLRIRRRERQRKTALRFAAAAACLAMMLGVGVSMLSRSADAPDLVAEPEIMARVLSADDRVFAARADDYFHLRSDCANAMAEQVELPLVTALEFEKQKCSLCGAHALLPGGGA